MTRSRVLFRAPILAWALACTTFAGAWLPARAAFENAAAHAPRGDYVFDIPAQPLDAAVRTYALITGQSVLASSSALRGRASRGLRGTYTAAEALERLLGGTGLQGRMLSGDAVAIVLAETDAPAGVPPGAGAVPLSRVDAVQADGADHRGYVSRLQGRLVAALCGSSLTRPGRYRLALRVSVDASGSVSVLRRSGGPAGAGGDAAIGQALRELRLDPPPAGMPQPITILLRPDGAGVRTDCPAGAARGG